MAEGMHKGRLAARRGPGFTLIEMLVVIAIIGILAGILMPVFAAARERSRQATCTNQLRQFSVAVEIYRMNFPDHYVPWLSTLYPQYLATEKVFVCPSDQSGGLEGGVPTWFSEWGASQFPETDDTLVRDDQLATLTGELVTLEKEAKKYRVAALERSSYTYEFSWSPCTWWYNDGKAGTDEQKFVRNKDSDSYKWADFDNNGYVSWYEAKRTEMKGMQYDSSAKKVVVDENKIYGGHVPMVRCFWHVNRKRKVDSIDKEVVLNLACENKNVYACPLLGDGWKEAAKQK